MVAACTSRSDLLTASAMQPPVKKRRIETAAVEEIKFDIAARQEYLTGFHKRKLQRVKHAQEAAEKKARLERIEERRKVRTSLLTQGTQLMMCFIQLREERKADLERHVQEANTFLQPLQDIETEGESENEPESREAESWDGISEPPNVDHEAEYVDEDRYTMVTVEAMDLSKVGLHIAEENLRKQDRVDEDGQDGSNRVTGKGENMNEKRKWTREKPKERQDHPKKKKKKFRYESKGERKAARVKDKMRKSKQATARRAA
jgi:ribosomal RNA-processing protein 17